jgi:hypothetical protein
MADRYWVGDGGNWSDNTNHWAAATGAAPGVSLPTSADNVYFDANSFTAGGQIVTVDATSYCLDMDWTGATNTPTLEWNQYMASYGNVTMIAAMINTGSIYGLQMKATGTLLTNGVSMPKLYFNDVNTNVTLGDNVSSYQSLSFSRGALNTANYNITCLIFTDTDSAIAHTLTLGTSVITCTSWNYGLSAGTIAPNTATINCSGNFAGGGITTYHIVNLTGATSTVSGSNTFDTLALPSGTTQTITFTDGTTQTATTFTLDGSSGHVHTLAGTGTAGWNLVQKYGHKVSADYLNLSYGTINKSYAGANSTDSGNNTGWVFTTPPALKCILI